MNDRVPRLIDAWAEAFDRSLPGGEWEEAPDGGTFCNEAVNMVCVRMGYTLFSRPTLTQPTGALMANEIFDLLAKGPDWMEVDGAVAQAHANAGAVVLAGWKNPTGGHGHVAVVRPGLPCGSDKWGVPADKPTIPKVANIGKKKQRFIGRGANWAFGEPPKYFVLKESIG